MQVFSSNVGDSSIALPRVCSTTCVQTASGDELVDKAALNEVDECTNDSKHDNCESVSTQNEFIADSPAFSDRQSSSEGELMIPDIETEKNFDEIYALIDTPDTPDVKSIGSPTKSNTCENCGQELSRNQSKTALNVGTPHSNRSSFSIFKPQSCDFCRICHCETDADEPLIAPCKCKGSLTFVHHSCLQKWIKSSGNKHCELCGFNFVMNSKLKPITKWQTLSMSKTERRKICCSVFFHVIAITCVVWSLYVLIEKTAFELKTGTLHWPFWTKLAVVAVGLSGGIAFMYVQCKSYFHLWTRWKAYNRIIFVQNRPLLLTETKVNIEVSNVPCTSLSTPTLLMTDLTRHNRTDHTINVS